MANEFWTTLGAGGDTLYVLIRKADKTVWEPAGQVFEAHGTGGRTNADYDIAVTDGSAGLYTANMDANITTEGYYIYEFYYQVGGAPADTDTCIASGTIKWSGTAEEKVHDKLDDIISDLNNVFNVYDEAVA